MPGFDFPQKMGLKWMIADFMINIFGELRSEKLPFVELQELLLNAENLSRGKRFGGNSVQERFSYRRLFFPGKNTT